MNAQGPISAGALGVLIAQALGVYLLVLGTHSLRRQVGLTLFYALLGGVTALMSWITDAGIRLNIGGITFMVGSTVYYTSLMLGVFVVYVFDGPRATTVAIATVALVSVLAPVVSAVLHYQLGIANLSMSVPVPRPSLRINSASVVATVLDLVFLVVAWEFLGRSRTRWAGLWVRAFLTLLGVMWLDVLLFATMAFAGTPPYLAIMKGTLISRLFVALVASPILYGYLRWEMARIGFSVVTRPLALILKEMAEIRAELSLAQREIEHRKIVEKRNAELIKRLEEALARVSRLEGLLPICSVCHKVRFELPDTPEGARKDFWIPLEDYIRNNTPVRISHGICDDCLKQQYPDLEKGNPHSAT